MAKEKMKIGGEIKSTAKSDFSLRIQVPHLMSRELT